MSIHFSSVRMDWRTPKTVYDRLDAEFSFDFDPCPTNPTFDGLSIPWGNRNYVNPPYGRQIPLWFDKAWREAGEGKMSVFLVPSRTDTNWWHRYAMKAAEIRFIWGRLRFDDFDDSAPFPTALVIIDPSKNQGQAEVQLPLFPVGSSFTAYPKETPDVETEL